MGILKSVTSCPPHKTDVTRFNLSATKLKWSSPRFAFKTAMWVMLPSSTFLMDLLEAVLNQLGVVEVVFARIQSFEHLSIVDWLITT